MGKKNKSKKKGKEESASKKGTANTLPSGLEEALKTCTPAAIIRNIENSVKESPDHDSCEIDIATRFGDNIRLKRTNKRNYWFLEGEKITRPELYNIVKDNKTESKGEKKNKKSDINEKAPLPDTLKRVYKKKKIEPALEKAGFKPKKIKKIIAAIDAKKIDGNTLVITIEDITGEMSMDTMNGLFDFLA